MPVPESHSIKKHYPIYWAVLYFWYFGYYSKVIIKLGRNTLISMPELAT
ncbi:hypothetical protein [Vibrio gallaecicus]|nr:hypothetical protein [Vibrio gallaecicus]MDN3616584.1 hypothetical protein [Vibrio gallaecicus]